MVMDQKTGVWALHVWCRSVCEGYPGLNISNMSSSWRDGVGFCALIHRHRPDILDWDLVDHDNWRSNCSLAFTTAEEHLGIPALLDVDDVVLHPSPDRLSILTYISLFYHKLAHPGSDSGISSPSSSDSEAESPEVRGAILSLMDGRRVRSVSCQERSNIIRGHRQAQQFPLLEKENPFRTQVQLARQREDEDEHNKSPADQVKRSSGSSFSGERSSAKVNFRKKKENKYGRPRMVQSMFVESNKDFKVNDWTNLPPCNQNPTLSITAIPRPYKNSETQHSVSLLSKTQSYLQERRRRSQSQPPEKRQGKKFEFLSTAVYQDQPWEVKQSDKKKGFNVGKGDDSKVVKDQCYPKKYSGQNYISFQESFELFHTKTYLQTLL